MPKRKLATEPSIAGSDLSPPPNGLLEAGAAVAVTNGHVPEKPSKRRKTRQTETDIDVHGIGKLTAKKSTSKRKVQNELEEEVKEDDRGSTSKPKKTERKQKVKAEEAEVDDTGKVVKKKAKKQRKSKAEKQAELTEMPLAARTAGHKLYIGAHVSSAGGMSCRHYMTQIEPLLIAHTTHRRAELRPQQRAHRCQRLRALPQIAAQVGQPSFAGRRVHILPRQLQEAFP